MILRLLLIITAIAASFFLSACTSEIDVDVSCDDFRTQNNINKEIKIAVDDVFTVTLCSNPTTGFQWELPRITDQAVLQQIDHKFMSPSAGTPDKSVPRGAPGQDVWTFRAVKKGTSTISAEYSRPWEGGEKAAWTFGLTVVVK